MTTMNNALLCRPILRFNIPNAADINAKGVINFRTSKAPCEKGSKTGISLYTESRENDDTDAMLPVEKKAD